MREFIRSGRFSGLLTLIDRSVLGDNVTLDVTEVLYPVHEALGSVISLARGSDGQLIKKISYDPYGQTHFERQVEDPPGSGTFVWSRTDSNGDAWGNSAYAAWSFFSWIRAQILTLSLERV